MHLMSFQRSNQLLTIDIRLSNASRQKLTTGEITNLMSIDATMIGDELAPYLNYIWSCPIQSELAK